MNNELNAIASNFNIWEHIEPYGDGHINETFEALPCAKRFILQKINSDVFEKPEEVMENIEAVTEHLRKKIIGEGGDPLRETLTIVKTLDGKSFYKTDDGRYYRMYIFIEGARTYNVVEKPEHFYNAAKAFGRFQKLLADFPADKLHETIKDFHNTPKRFTDFEKAITNNISGRADNVKKEIEFALKRKNIASVITDAIKDGSIPLRVTHNDTKYNNIMIDDLTGNAVAVIDLDTVMPGSLLYDYGDSLRFGTNPVSEDEKNLDLVYCDLNLFECFTRGFIEEMADTLTPDEIRLMPFSARLMTLECGIRFLGDYINGDVYFRTAYSEHNLDRARTQFKLVYDKEQKQSEMDKIVSDIIGKLSEK